MELSEVLNTGVAAPAAVGGAWMLKEFFSFLLRWRKAEQREAKDLRGYHPDDEWRKYCTEKFDSIISKLNELTTEFKVMESQAQTLRLQVSRIETDLRTGGENGRH